MGRARADTYNYLMNLRGQIGALIEGGGDIMAAPQVDQSAVSHLEPFALLAAGMRKTAFQLMEWK